MMYDRTGAYDMQIVATVVATVDAEIESILVVAPNNILSYELVNWWCSVTGQVLPAR